MINKITEEEYNTLKTTTKRVIRGAISHMLLTHVEVTNGDEKVFINNKEIAFSKDGEFFKLV